MKPFQIKIKKNVIGNLKFTVTKTKGFCSNPIKQPDKDEVSINIYDIFK